MSGGETALLYIKFPLFEERKKQVLSSAEDQTLFIGMDMVCGLAYT